MIEELTKENEELKSQVKNKTMKAAKSEMKIKLLTNKVKKYKQRLEAAKDIAY